MKLLFDENLAPHLPGVLVDAYPGSLHVHNCGFGIADDSAIWLYAKDHGVTIVSRSQTSLARCSLSYRWNRFCWWCCHWSRTCRCWKDESLIRSQD